MVQNPYNGKADAKPNTEENDDNQNGDRQSKDWPERTDNKWFPSFSQTPHIKQQRSFGSQSRYQGHHTF